MDRSSRLAIDNKGADLKNTIDQTGLTDRMFYETTAEYTLF